MTNTLPPPFLVRFRGIIKDRPFHSTPVTKQNDAMLFIFLYGKGTFLHKNIKRPISGETIALFTPEDKEGLIISDPTEPYCHYYCRFSGDYAFQMANDIIKTRKDNFFSPPDINDIINLMESMEVRYKKDLPTAMGEREALLVKILIKLANPSERKDDSPKILNASHIVRYLNDHISEPTDLNQMAEYFSVAKSTLCRNAQKLFGKTVLQISEEIKMEHAELLLRLGNLKIKEVALRTGYLDPLYFSRVFKKTYNQNPSDIQKKPLTIN